MKKHNIGRIGFLVVLFNVIFMLIYLADRNAENIFYNEATQQRSAELTVYKEGNVGDEAVILLESAISDRKYEPKDIEVINSYQWILTDDEDLSSYALSGKEIRIRVSSDEYEKNINQVLDEIIGE